MFKKKINLTPHFKDSTNVPTVGVWGGWGGGRALHWAAEKGQVEVVFALVELGVSVHVADVNGSTPLHLASRKGQVEVLLVLQVVYNPNPCNPEPLNPMSVTQSLFPALNP